MWIYEEKEKEEDKSEKKNNDVLKSMTKTFISLVLSMSKEEGGQEWHTQVCGFETNMLFISEIIFALISSPSWLLACQITTHSPAFSSFTCFCFVPSAFLLFLVLASTMSALSTAKLWLILARLRFSINGLLARFGSPLSPIVVPPLLLLELWVNLMLPPPPLPPDDDNKNECEPLSRFAVEENDF
jgi:hypothetical protein